VRGLIWRAWAAFGNLGGWGGRDKLNRAGTGGK